MKPRLVVSRDGKPVGIRVILANSRGHILYDREKDRNLKTDTSRRNEKPRAVCTPHGAERKDNRAHGSTERERKQ